MIADFKIRYDVRTKSFRYNINTVPAQRSDILSLIRVNPKKYGDDSPEDILVNLEAKVKLTSLVLECVYVGSKKWNFLIAHGREHIETDDPLKVKALLNAHYSNDMANYIFKTLSRRAEKVYRHKAK